MFIPKLIIAAAAGGLALAPAYTAGASSTAAETKIVLDRLCEERGGMPVYSPYSIARCQDARANKGFESERMICEEATGEFTVAINARHQNRASWGCSPTAPPA